MRGVSKYTTGLGLPEHRTRKGLANCSHSLSFPPVPAPLQLLEAQHHPTGRQNTTRSWLEVRTHIFASPAVSLSMSVPIDLHIGGAGRRQRFKNYNKTVQTFAPGSPMAPGSPSKPGKPYNDGKENHRQYFICIHLDRIVK